MLRLAVDIVLLPEDMMMQRAIEANRMLSQKSDPKIILGTKNSIPHISLSMGVITESDIPAAAKVLRDIAEQYPTMNLNAFIISSKTIPNRKIVTEFRIEKTKKLEDLHETVMEKLSSYLTHDATLETLYSPPEPEDITLHWINSYAKESAHENFSPHITLGIGKIKDSPLSFPLKFAARKLALCHLGNYCTCRKILAAAFLKK